MPITGLGPHGERAAPPTRVTLSDDDISAARALKASVAVVFHTTDSDWSRQQLAGMTGALGECGIVVNEIVDCAFDADRQIAELDRIAQSSVDAVISIPVANTTVADAHKDLSQSGKHLILNDNVPTGLLPSRDYTSLVSADNFGLGLIAAELLSPHLPNGAEIGILTFGVDFYATNEREIAFGRHLRAVRADLKVYTKRFADPKVAGDAALDLLKTNPGIAGLFVVWDDPALDVADALKSHGISLPITTVDLGYDAAVRLSASDMIVGIAAQQPYQQGLTAARAAALSLLERPVPSWIALPGLPVTRENVIESYQTIWNSAAPPQVLASIRNQS